MQDNSTIYKARALYYNLFANFFVPPYDMEHYLSLLSLVSLLKENSLDMESSKALEEIETLLEKTSNSKLIQEYDDLFLNPITARVRQTASFYDEGVESGKKRVEMINFVGKTKLRRDEKNYFEYEDSIGFIFSFMAQLCDNIARGEEEYINTTHCVFSEILNNFIDEFASLVYEDDNAVIFKELMVVLHSFIEFERLFLDVSKPVPKERIQKEKKEEIISEEEKERRARNKALKAQGPKKKKDDEEPTDVQYDVETDIEV